MNITSYNEEEVTNMKRIATAILVLVLLVAVAVPAFAMREKMYVKKDCKAYA